MADGTKRSLSFFRLTARRSRRATDVRSPLICPELWVVLRKRRKNAKPDGHLRLAGETQGDDALKAGHGQKFEQRTDRNSKRGRGELSLNASLVSRR